jgi:Glutamate synthase central domain
MRLPQIGRVFSGMASSRVFLPDRDSDIALAERADAGFTADVILPADLERLQTLFAVTRDDLRRASDLATCEVGRDHAARTEVSLTTAIGPIRRPSMRRQDRTHTIVSAPSPVLTEHQMRSLRRIPGVRAETVSMVFPVISGTAGLELVLTSLVHGAVAAVARGSSVIILSDRAVDAHVAPVPAVLAVDAVHRGLIAEGLRTEASLVVETADARNAGDVSALIARGATAIFPYLAYHVAASLPECRPDAAIETFRRALEQGLRNAARETGLGRFSAYCDGEYFETPLPASSTAPLSVRALGRQALDRHATAWTDAQWPVAM